MANAILHDLLFSHSGTSRGGLFEVSIRRLRLTLWSVEPSLRRFLEGATQNKKDEDVRNWIQKVRCLVYDAENVVDLFAQKIEYYKRGESVAAALKGLTKTVSKLKTAELILVDKFRDVVANMIEPRVDILIRFAADKGAGVNSGSSPSSSIDKNNVVKVKRMDWPQVEEYRDHKIENYQESSIIMFEMKRDIEKLLSLLIDDDDHQNVTSIVSILGVEGSGKTTLARKIYYHIKTRTHFAGFAWVSMSTEYYQNDYTIVHKDILKQLSKSSSNSPKRVNNNITNWEQEDDLRTDLRETKCLVVLLDVRNKQVVDGLIKSLSFLGKNSKLLLTTSDLKVAELGFTHKIIGFDENEAWEILNKRSYRQPVPGLEPFDELVLDKVNSILGNKYLSSILRFPNWNARIKEFMGRSMVRRCGYLPIAILVLAEILRFYYKWKEVGDQLHLIDEGTLRILLNSLLWNNSEPSEDKGRVGDNLDRLFYWNYDQLPDELRECFLYLSHFAEEEFVDVETLYLMWIGEGLVKSLDVAELYLTVLSRRYLVEVKDSAARDFRSRYESCRVTSRMRGPWLKELREQSGYLEVSEDNLVADKKETSSKNITSSTSSSTRYVTTIANAHRMLVSTNKGLNENDCEKVVEKVKKLAQDSQPCDSSSTTSELMMQMKSSTTGELMMPMRSLLFRNTSAAGELPPCITLPAEFLVASITGVRILVFESYKFKDINKDRLEKVLENLILLRFLSFKNSELDELPSSACTSSPYLEALDLRVAWGYQIRIPNTFWKAKKLRHLFFSDTSMEVADGKKLRLSGLDNLEVLVNFQSDIMKIGDISELKNLQVLKAVVRDNNSLSWIVRHKLKCDLYLRIRGCDSEHVPKLQGKKESSDDSSKLQFLEILGTLPGNKLPTYIQVISTGLVELVLVLSEIHQENDPMKTLEKFPKLKRLVLGNRAFSGQEMVCSQSGFPSLKSICLTELADLKQWKIANGAMPNLNRLVIKRCSNLELPDGLNNFSNTLKQLSTWSMPKRFNDSVRDLGLKWDRAECSFSFNLELKNDI
ncbi:hypothetical protein ACH5RR_031542 [Cinchona calisaya]|uniref:Uncharacterized protein n=1 Tax=Cinchona calisaya TaxID=153742 RepID=A0ABD2YJ04_9GENT